MATENIDSSTQPATKTCCKTSSVLKTILLIVGVAVATILGLAALQPQDFRVSRSATMSAAPETVFAYVNDLRNWENWSPWAKLDPDAETSFDGPTSGTGAKFYWNGDSNVGEGTMTVTESQPSELIRMRLDFVRPFAGTSDVEFTFLPTAEQTNVTWTMTGKNNFLGKVISLFMDCEKMTGGFFEEGLANLKSLVESPPRT